MTEGIMQIVLDFIEELKSPVSSIILISIVSSIVIYQVYQVLCQFVRGQKAVMAGKKRQKER